MIEQRFFFFRSIDRINKESRMRKRSSLIACLTGFMLFSLTAAGLAADFSADMINKAGGRTFKGKIFVSKDKTRMESPESISITRMDKKVVWILMPKEKMYMEQSFNPAQAPATSEKVTGEVERKKIGQEVIDGKNTDKYEVVYLQNKKKTSMYQWIAQSIAMPVKMAAVDGSWSIEYKNIKTGKQPDSIFEIPQGYQSFSMGKPTMKDLFKGLSR
jgi:hypothetical protein